ncbi:MAG: hypothetical protein KBD28_12345, partial [Chitinophagaceae bacterium]|nr:hypothetical protein [Chitinophagaceae bacterium]
FGVQTWAENERYEGYWINDLRQGQGKMLFPSGSEYNGNWNQDKIHGSGKMKYQNGEVYTGNFTNATINGYGKFEFINGDVYEGYWKMAVMDGKGKMMFSNGDIYEGDFKNSMLEGVGTYKYKNGDTYTGDLKNNLQEGIGTYNYKNGNVFVGSFKNGLMNGKGIYNYANGNWYNGEFLNNNYHGFGEEYNIDGLHVAGYFINNQLHGLAKRLLPTGYYEEGLIDSINNKLIAGKVWLLDGSIKEGFFDKKTYRLQGYGLITDVNNKVTQGKFAANKLVEKLTAEQYEKKYGKINLPKPPTALQLINIGDTIMHSSLNYLCNSSITILNNERTKKTTKISIEKMATTKANVIDWDDTNAKLLSSVTGKNASYTLSIYNNDLKLIGFSYEKNIAATKTKPAEKKTIDTFTNLKLITLPSGNTETQNTITLNGITTNIKASYGNITTDGTEQPCLWISFITNDIEKQFCFVAEKGIYAIKENGEQVFTFKETMKPKTNQSSFLESDFEN